MLFSHVGASLLAMESEAPRLARQNALSLTTIASKLAPTGSNPMNSGPAYFRRSQGSGSRRMSWGSQDMTIADPFGNRLVFTNAISL
jgi:hypothetical protein